MGRNERHDHPPITRLTLSGGRSTQPRLMMAHPIGEAKAIRRARVAFGIVLTLTIVILLALGGASK